MDYQTSIIDIYHLRWKTIALNSTLCLIILMMGVACRVSEYSTSPLRNFNTSDLIITPASLPPGWETVEGPSPESSHLLGMRKNLGGTYILLRDSVSNIDHVVAVFPSNKDAARAYNDHDFTGDTQGEFAKTWKTPSGITYDSQIADQFRVVCVDIKNKDKTGIFWDICVVEAQYEEFVSVLIYRTDDASHIISDLEIIAKAIDTQFEKYLGN